MIHGLVNDLAQRFVTLNKLEQKSNLKRWLKNIKLPAGSKVLDFGCGTGLFANLFKKQGYIYYGYDIDNRLIKYASRIYPNCKFTDSGEFVNIEAPYNLILANCCFHHIEDNLLIHELEKIEGLLADDGTLLIVDDLKAEKNISFLRCLFMKLEKGQYLRTINANQKIIERKFFIKESKIERAHVLSIKSKLNVLYRDLGYFECIK